MQTQVKLQDSLEGLSPSFSCYSSDNLTSKAIAKAIHEEHKSSRFNELGDVEGEDFEFSLGLDDEEASPKDINLKSWNVNFPVFNRDLLVDREIDGSTSISSSLQKLFIDNHDEEESSSHSSSEVDELENIPSGTFCVWRPKAESGSSSPAATMTKCKKSSSTGSTGSKKWKIRYSFKRSNSEGKELPMVLLPSNNKKSTDDTSPKQKRNSNKLKSQTPVHELFYVQRRAETEMGKKKSYLPYRKEMFGLFANGNGMGKMLPF